MEGDEIDLNGGWCLVGGAFRKALRPLWSLLLAGFVTPLHPFFVHVSHESLHIHVLFV